MADGTETTGTPEPPPNDGNATATGTSAEGQDGGNAQEDLTHKVQELENQKQQWLAEKSNYEETKRRLRDAEDRLSGGGYGTAPANPGNPAYQAALEAQQTLAQLQLSEDPAHRLLAASILYQQQSELRNESERRFQRELAKVPLDHQAEVDEQARRNGVSPSIQWQAMKGELYDKQQADLSAREKRLREQEEAMKRGRVDTTTVPIPGRDLAKANYSPEQLAKDAEAAEFGDAEARKRLDDFNRGKMRFG